jgi:hypothetical protein
MKRAFSVSVVLLVTFTVGPASRLDAQSASPWGRVSFIAESFGATDHGRSIPGFSELVFSATLASPTRDQGGFEYRFDMRTAGYPQAETRNTRFSLYDGYVGQRFAGGAFGVRVGQMWLNDLGGLGSIGGVQAEFVRRGVAGFRRLRIGGFGGLEPKILEAGYVNNVTKAGGYLALEGQVAWRNVLGFVVVRNSGLTERAVLTTTNFLPVGKTLLVYQAAEIDLVGPAGNGSGGLTYFFANARYSPVPSVELQGLYHRGRSIDARTITLDQLNGRPISQRALEGFLYESAGGRVTVTVVKGFRLFAGYARDRNNRDDAPTNRISVGGFASNVLGSGFDVRISDDRVDGPTLSYDSWYGSVGRSIGPRVYLSVDYSSSLSVFQAFGQQGFLIENRPRTNRYSLSGLVNLTRWISLVGSLERTRDGGFDEWRWMSGLTYRF